MFVRVLHIFINNTNTYDLFKLNARSLFPCFLEPVSGGQGSEIRPNIDRAAVYWVSYNMLGHTLRRFTMVRLCS